MKAPVMPTIDIANKMKDQILLAHGSGGKKTHELITDLFVKHFNNSILSNQSDSAIIENNIQNLAFTTDSFVVDPIFFPGGNIGKLSIAGTVNDIAVSGAVPKYLSCSFILEEGLLFSDLTKIVESMAAEAYMAGVKIVTGDTKVVNKGKCDKIFITTSAIGILEKKNKHISFGKKIKVGDKVLINGSVAEHGMSILSTRNDMNLHAEIRSDCACLNHMIKSVLDSGHEVKFMRDATRGGVATVIAELAENKSYGITIDESQIQIKENVRGLCELLGFDPLYVANEGKVVMIVSKDGATPILDIMKNDKLGRQATIIGEVVEEYPGKAWLKTVIGGKRIIDLLTGEQLPRIC